MELVLLGEELVLVEVQDEAVVVVGSRVALVWDRLENAFVLLAGQRFLIEEEYLAIVRSVQNAASRW